MLPRLIRPLMVAVCAAVLSTACDQEEVSVAYPLPIPDYRLTSVWMRDENGKELGAVWKATYYPDGRLKSISDDRDSTYLGYAYDGKEIIVSELSKPTFWPPFSYHKLQLNEKNQVSMTYFGQEKADTYGQYRDTTAYVYDDAGFIIEQLRRGVFIDNTRKSFYSTVRVSNQIKDGNIVTTFLQMEPEYSYGFRNYQLSSAFYPDKEDKNAIQAIYRFHPWRFSNMPFAKASVKLPRRFSYIHSDGSTEAYEFSYQFDGQGNVTRITERIVNGSSSSAGREYSLRYNE
jgi:hypothetical protein